MMYVWLLLLVIVNGLWLGTVLLGLPGNWLIVMTTSVFAWWKWDQGVFSAWTLIAIALLALIGEVIEFFAGMVGARKSGASWTASLVGVVGAIVGGLVGTVVFPVPLLGTILGTCLGAGLSVWSIEISRGEMPHISRERALGAGKGKLLGILGKFVIGVLIWMLVAVAAFWP